MNTSYLLNAFLRNVPFMAAALLALGSPVVRAAGPMPTIDSISPTSGPKGGGTLVTITGSNLNSASAVQFGDTAATGFTVVNANHITATSPAHLAGTVDITVTTPNGTNTLAVTDQFEFLPSSDADLSGLELNNGTLTPAFDSATTSYTASVPYTTTSVTVTPTVAEAFATVTVNDVAVASGAASDAISMAVGENTITVAVTAEDATTVKTYTVTMTRETQAPTVTSSTSSAITATAVTLGGNVTDDGGATVTERGVVYAVTGTNSNPQIDGTGVTKVAGSGTTGVFTVDVTGLTPATTYSYAAYATNSVDTGYASVNTFTTPNNDARLAGLVLSSGTLAPVFDSATANYTAGVANATGSITVTPTTADSNATVTVNATPVESSAASGAISLAVGDNTITIVVTAEDGTTAQTYTVVVTRAAVPPTVTTPTSDSITGTSATLGGNVTTDGGSTVTGRGIVYAVTSTNGNPQIGGTGVTQVAGTGTTGVFTVGVTGLATGTGYSYAAYATNVAGTSYSSVGTFATLPSTDASLAGLVLSTGTLAPVFASATTSYTAALPGGITNLTVTPTVTDGTASVTVNGTVVPSGTASGSISFGVGNTLVTVVVTAQDGVTTKTYTVTLTSVPVITSPTATAITATSVTLGGNVTFDGNGAVTQRGIVYALTSANSDPQIDGTGVTNVPVAGTTGLFTADVTGLASDGSYSFAAYATNGSGTSYTSIGTFTTFPADYADLSDLVLSDGALSPAFASGTTFYTVLVANTTSSLMVTPTLANSAASVTVNGTAVDSGTASNPVTLAVGDNTITVVVTAQDAVTTNTYTLTVTRQIPPPSISTQPTDQVAAVGGSVTLTVDAGEGSTVQWQRNGANMDGATAGTLTLSNLQPSDAGLYVAVATNAGGTTASNPAIVGVQTTDPVVGDGTVLATDILHPNGNYYDQVLLTGAAEALTARDGKVTRTSFIDLNDDIVQVEFSGHGTLNLVLDDASGPAAPVNYTQAVNYMKGHARIVIVGADETTNVLVFTVGRATAFDPTGAYNIIEPISETNDPANNGSPLFTGHESTEYDGIADLSYIAVASTDGGFGGVRTADARYWATSGVTGVYAPNVDLQGPLFVGEIDARDTATPTIIVGSTPDARVTGGRLLQTNSAAVRVHGLTQLVFTDGTDSGGNLLPAQDNQAVLLDNGVDVTSEIVVNP